MAIVFDRDFGRVWSDGATPYIFSSIVFVPQPEELNELVEKQLGLIRELKRKYGEVYSILDLRLCPQLPAPIIQHYIDHIVPLQFKAGLKHKALVATHEKKSFEVLAHAFISIANLPLSIHYTFENALDKLNQKHALAKAEVRPKSFFSLFSNLVR